MARIRFEFAGAILDAQLMETGTADAIAADLVRRSWCLEDGEPRHMRTSFDVERAVRETGASPWPMAAEFVEENLLRAVTREEAIAAQEARR